MVFLTWSDFIMNRKFFRRDVGEDGYSLVELTAATAGILALTTGGFTVYNNISSENQIKALDTAASNGYSEALNVMTGFEHEGDDVDTVIQAKLNSLNNATDEYHLSYTLEGGIQENLCVTAIANGSWEVDDYVAESGSCADITPEENIEPEEENGESLSWIRQGHGMSHNHIVEQSDLGFLMLSRTSIEFTPNIKNVKYGWTNGINWNDKTDDRLDAKWWQDTAISDEGRIVAVSSGNGNQWVSDPSHIFYTDSDNPLELHSSDSHISDYINSVTYGHDRFVASSRGNSIHTSYNGESWIEVDPPLSDRMRCTSSSDMTNVVATNNGFIRIDCNGNMVHSNDGLEWEEHGSIPEEDFKLGAAHHDNGKLIALNNNASNVAVSEDNGHNWEIHDIPVEDADWNAIEYGNGHYVAVGENSSLGTGEYGGFIISSKNGEDWSLEEFEGSTDIWYDIAFNEDNGQFAVTSVGNNAVALGKVIEE